MLSSDSRQNEYTHSPSGYQFSIIKKQTDPEVIVVQFQGYRKDRNWLQPLCQLVNKFLPTQIRQVLGGIFLDPRMDPNCIKFHMPPRD